MLTTRCLSGSSSSHYLLLLLVEAQTCPGISSDLGQVSCTHGIEVVTECSSLSP
jgi:hypothetical protein